MPKTAAEGGSGGAGGAARGSGCHRMMLWSAVVTATNKAKRLSPPPIKQSGRHRHPTNNNEAIVTATNDTKRLSPPRIKQSDCHRHQ